MHALLGAWLQLAAAGVVTATGACLRLRALDHREGWGRALLAAPRGRQAFLVATCDNSDAPWAHLVRAYLLKTATGANEPYRQPAAPRSPHGTIHAQRWRIVRAAVLAVAGAAGLAASSAALGRADGLRAFAALVLVAACALLFFAIAGASRALSTLHDAAARLPDVVRTLPPAPASTPRSGPTPIARVRAGGCALVLFGVPTAILLLAVGASTTATFDASGVGAFAGGLVMTAIFAFVLSVLVRRASFHLDEGGTVLVTTTRGFVLPVTRLIIPTEIIRNVRLDERSSARGVSWDVIVDIGTQDRVVCLSWSYERDARRVIDAVRAVSGGRGRGDTSGTDG
jgi:hypothetical protein